MNRPFIFGLLAGAATWALMVNGNAERRLRAKDAAEMLRSAWAEHNTTV
jgi:hypothetical protein